MASTKINDLFNGKFFQIPAYQRGYAWERQNIRELFEDINESIESCTSHYIGTIVLSKSDDDDLYYVVDGQQRITTLTIVINALVKRLEEKYASFYERFYVKDDERYRLSPLNRDQEFFIGLLESGTGDPQNKSQRYLKDAYEEISFKIDRIDDKLKFLKCIEKLEIMSFVENSEGDAIRIFQTVNDRGKPLSNMEKAKSLLIYFSNRYLEGTLDDAINDCFSEIFEIYDDIKHLGEELGITLIRNRDFNEDNLMRYHFVTYSNQNYDPTAHYVLQYLKNELTRFRNEATDGEYIAIHEFINSYTSSLKSFFYNCKQVIERAKTNAKYYKLFSILNLSATLYPLVIKLEQLAIIDASLSNPGRTANTFFDLVELIEVRVYKTRATDPKADIARLVYDIDHKSAKQIEDWLIWFNSRWMPKEQFQSNLYGKIYGNRALPHIFIEYSESINRNAYTTEELQSIVNESPTIEHILSQTPNFDPKAFGFKSKEDFVDFEDTIGNLAVLEKRLNSSIQNKSAIDKVDGYGKSLFSMVKKVGSEIDTKKTFTKTDILNRTKELADYCLERWWCEVNSQDQSQGSAAS